MKITKLSTFASILLFAGCYTQFESGDYQRQPDLTKVERKIDSNTTQTDYYDNRMYSRYFQQFGSGYSFRHYDPFYDNYSNSAYNDFYFGWNYNQYYYSGYDYMNYRMDSWYYSRFGYWPNQYYCYNQPYYYGGGNYNNGNDNNNYVVTPSRRNRQGRNVAGNEVLSNNYYLPAVGSGVRIQTSNTNVLNPNSSNSNNTRNSISFGSSLPIILQGSSGTSNSTANSSIGSQPTNVSPPVINTPNPRGSIDFSSVVPPKPVENKPNVGNTNPPPAANPPQNSSQPRQRQGRTKGN